MSDIEEYKMNFSSINEEEVERSLPSAVEEESKLNVNPDENGVQRTSRSQGLLRLGDYLKKRLTVKNKYYSVFWAEFFGTFILLFFGNGAVAQMVVSQGRNGTFLSVNLAYGIGAALGIVLSGNVSGGHINPAVTLVMYFLGNVSLIMVPIYILAQYLGAFFASCITFAIYYNGISNLDGGKRQVTGPVATAGIFSTYPADYVSIGTAFLDQVVGTAALLFCVMAITNAKLGKISQSAVGVMIGLVIITIGMTYGSNCGYPINPARDLAPRIFTAMAGYGVEVFAIRNYAYFWVPVIGPHIGAFVGAYLYVLLIGLPN